MELLEILEKLEYSERPVEVISAIKDVNNTWHIDLKVVADQQQESGADESNK